MAFIIYLKVWKSKAICWAKQKAQTNLPSLLPAGQVPLNFLAEQTKYHFRALQLACCLVALAFNTSSYFWLPVPFFKTSTFWKFFPKIAIFQIFIAWVRFFISCPSLRWHSVRLGCIAPVSGWYQTRERSCFIRPQIVKYTKVLSLGGKDLYK